MLVRLPTTSAYPVLFSHRSRDRLRPPSFIIDRLADESLICHSYDNYLEGNRNSGIGALGMGMMNGDMDDDDDDEQGGMPPVHTTPNGYPDEKKNAALAAALQQPAPHSMPEPLPAPRPGYVANTNPFHIPAPAPAAVPQGRQMSQVPPNLASGPRPPALAIPPPAPISVPSTPHPLPPTMTPITPAFARPMKPTGQRDVQFGKEPIMRSNSEERLLPRRGEKGDDFWRRFSMIAKEETKKPYKQRLVLHFYYAK